MLTRQIQTEDEKKAKKTRLKKHLSLIAITLAIIVAIIIVVAVVNANDNTDNKIYYIKDLITEEGHFTLKVQDVKFQTNIRDVDIEEGKVFVIIYLDIETIEKLTVKFSDISLGEEKPLEIKLLEDQMTEKIKIEALEKRSITLIFEMETSNSMKILKILNKKIMIGSTLLLG